MYLSMHMHRCVGMLVRNVMGHKIWIWHTHTQPVGDRPNNDANTLWPNENIACLLVSISEVHEECVRQYRHAQGSMKNILI